MIASLFRGSTGGGYKDCVWVSLSGLHRIRPDIRCNLSLYDTYIITLHILQSQRVVLMSLPYTCYKQELIFFRDNV